MSVQLDESNVNLKGNDVNVINQKIQVKVGWGSTFFQVIPQLSHKKQPAAAHCAQSLGKSADSGSVENRSSLPHHRLDLPATLPHDASTGREQTTLNAVSLVARRIAHARFACAKQYLQIQLLSKTNAAPGHYHSTERTKSLIASLATLDL